MVNSENHRGALSPNGSNRLLDIGEHAAISRLAALLPCQNKVPVGIGDDAAVVSTGDEVFDWLLTSDPVIEGVHFLPEVEGRLIGSKAVGRVLSDIAAMGGEAQWLLIDVVATAETFIERLERIYKGAQQAAADAGGSIIGGDLARGPLLELHVFGVGRVPKGKALLRSGARPGDAIYVTGTLGGSALGHHLNFSARLQEGAWLRETGWVSAMCDVSDGLLVDLEHILEASEVGACLNPTDIPVSKAACRMDDHLPALQHALCDGEDFELLFTVPEKSCNDLEKSWQNQFLLPCTRIGTIIPGNNIAWDGPAPTAGIAGYEHFRQ